MIMRPNLARKREEEEEEEEEVCSTSLPDLRAEITVCVDVYGLLPSGDETCKAVFRPEKMDGK